MSLQRVGEGGEFPGSEVSGEEEDAFAAGIGALEVFEAVVDDDARDIFAGVAGEEADFGELASEGDEFAAKQAAAFALRAYRGRRESDCAGLRGADVHEARRRLSRA